MGAFPRASPSPSEKIRPRASRTRASGETPLARAAATSFASSGGASGKVNAMNTHYSNGGLIESSHGPSRYVLSDRRRRLFQTAVLSGSGTVRLQDGIKAFRIGAFPRSAIQSLSDLIPRFLEGNVTSRFWTQLRFGRGGCNRHTCRNCILVSAEHAGFGGRL